MSFGDRYTAMNEQDQERERERLDQMQRSAQRALNQIEENQQRQVRRNQERCWHPRNESLVVEYSRTRRPDGLEDLHELSVCHVCEMWRFATPGRGSGSGSIRRATLEEQLRGNNILQQMNENQSTVPHGGGPLPSAVSPVEAWTS